jgi:SAM-dependent methyltransferase
MRTTAPIIDRSREMDERSWWDLWNKTHRTKEDNDPVSSELFTRTAAVINEITQKKPCKVLEIGCGAGALSRLLTYSSYHGLDISPAAIDLARQKSEDISRPAGTGLPTYEAADFHAWPLPLDKFDLAVCVDAVMCFRDQQLALNKMAQSLRPGGRLVLTAINPFVYTRIRRTQTNPLASGPVSRWVTRSELQQLITTARLAIEHSYTIMPRGNRGILRLVNARRVNEAFGPRSAEVVRRLKERMGFGQYRLMIARNGNAL